MGSPGRRFRKDLKNDEELGHGPGSTLSTRRMEARLGKPWPRSQIWPIALICISCELRMGFTFLNGWGGVSKEEYLMASEKSYEI